MRRTLSVLLMLACIVAGATTIHSKQSPDDYVRDRVVLLSSIKGTCSGVEVRSPSGKPLTLTAGHCHELLVDDKMTAEMEDGKRYTLSLVAMDPKSDLMLLTGIPGKYLDVAKKYEGRHQHIHTMTHGEGMPSYRTDGEILKETDNQVLAFIISAHADLITCQEKGGEPALVSIFEMGCIEIYHSMMTTAKVVPGSSGGPVLNDKEQVIGIVSISNQDGFSGMVTIDSINAFLKGR